ncbi:premnaspirodiene oxygenase-like [Elaeis guineensis]|uniref:Premnaspirodiene oxygenase-like n=2 Tax=Elaeis guineensis var. tenera TaxID=51953 RepID=A0A6I9RWD7_ELAGV|nr:premnaspirodiene oxygenase-like [Elaeis guineensis]
MIINPKYGSKTQNKVYRQPPGPCKLPIIGSMHHLVGKLTHHALRDLAKTYGPLMHLKLGEVSTVVVTSREAAREMLKIHDINFASRPDILASKIAVYGGLDMLFAPYGDYWRRLRKLCVMEVLSAKRVQSFQFVREEEVSDLIDTIQSTSPSPVNLSEMLHTLTNNITARVAFGSRCRDAAAYLEAMKEGTLLAGGFNLADLFPSLGFISVVTGIKNKLERCHQKIDGILEGIIEERKEVRAALKLKDGNGETMEENILDVLLNFQGRDDELGFSLTATNIKAFIFDVFAAGSGTAASSMTWTMSELMRNPRVMKKAQTEVREALGGKSKFTEKDVGQLSYLKLVIKESLRLHPPAPLLVPRECTKTCEINSYVIPVKTRVIFNAWAMGRDSQYWDDPEEFKPERFEGSSIDFKGNCYEYMPFGAGRRMCPGINFGLASMELALAQLLCCFDWSLPHGASELDMTESAGLGARRRYDLCLCATPYVPLLAN